MIKSFKQTYIDALKKYYYVGGMPEVVASFADEKDFNEARKIQKRILTAYEQDFSKQAPKEIVPKIRMLWNSIPSQLAKENKKFIYGLIREGARAKEYETAIMWISNCGLVHKVSRINAPYLPLKAYEDLKAFKLFIVDVGLLGAMVGLNQRTLLNGNELFTEFKGALTEQYVMQQLAVNQDLGVYYYTNDKAGNNKAKGINIDGFGPQFYRLMEPGHDGVLGFIFGVLDILRGTCTVIDKNGVLHILDVGDSSINILGAFIKVFAHFFSDVFTSAGIAPPFFSILQLCTGKSPFILKENGERVTFNNWVRFMYKHGYDMRHMLTMSIVPMVIELSVRTYFYLSNGAIDLKIIEDKRYKLKKTNMLMLSHSITMLGNVFKMFLYGWNPLAFNYSEFLILIKTAIVTIKSRSDYSQWVDKQLEDEWKEILSHNL